MRWSWCRHKTAVDRPNQARDSPWGCRAGAAAHLLPSRKRPGSSPIQRRRLALERRKESERASKKSQRWNDSSRLCRQWAPVVLGRPFRPCVGRTFVHCRRIGRRRHHGDPKTAQDGRLWPHLHLLLLDSRQSWWWSCPRRSSKWGRLEFRWAVLELELRLQVA